MNMDEIIVREVVEFVEKNTPNKKTFIGLNKVGLGLSEETKCKIKEHGIKLKKLIERYDALFELSMDDNALPIIRLRDPQGNGTSFQTNTAFRSNSGGNLENLFDFAFIPQDVERQLTELALKEDWGKKEEGKESALMKYIRYTFLKASRENQVLQRSNYACFDTGLVDKLYRNIYMVFTKNRDPEKQPYYYKDVCVAGARGSGKKIVELFNPLPKPAQYFNNPSDLLYYPIQEPKVDWEHIVIDNVTRLPKELLAKDLELDAENLPPKEQLQERLESDYTALRNIVASLRDALDKVWGRKQKVQGR